MKTTVLVELCWVMHYPWPLDWMYDIYWPTASNFYLLWASLNSLKVMMSERAEKWTIATVARARHYATISVSYFESSMEPMF